MGFRLSARRALASGLTLACALSVGSIHASTANAAGTPAVQRYVALGDSFTSGPVIPWLRLNPLGCARSTNNYPSWLADKLGIYNTSKFVDVSCGAATTEHMTQPQSVPLGTNAAQFGALTADTDLVTLGIGGNDGGVFGNLISKCPELRDSNPTGSPCRDYFTEDGVDTLKREIKNTQRKIAGVVRGIRTRSPQARVLVVGYPRLIPESGYCPSELPFADGDYRWGDSVEQALNAAVKNAATANGAVYVDTYGPSLGHDPCAGDAAWTNGTGLDLLGAIPYHPHKAGMIAEADIVFGVVRRLFDIRENSRTAARRGILQPDTQVASPQQTAWLNRQLSLPAH